MPGRKTLLILTALLAVFSLCLGTAAAQDINVDDMNNEQLLQLLQAIMQKLEEEDPAPVPADGPEPAGPVIPAEPEVPAFQVYTNKKLMIEQLPASYFIRPSGPSAPSEEPGNPGTTGETDTPGETGTPWEPDESYNTCVDNCANACYGISYSCYYNCVIDCSGHEPPPPAG